MNKRPETNHEWAQRDLAVVWHPCTQMHDHVARPPVPIRCGHGVWLEDFEGHRFIDGISSWWVNLLGHTHPQINRAISQQLEQIEHVLLADFTHEPVIRLSETLVARAPAGLTRCFYADSGSAAIEIALKMSLHYWRNCGQPQKTRFLSLQHGYHGETLGALALSDLGLYRAAYDPVLPDWQRILSPAGALGIATEEEVARAARALEEALIHDAPRTAAFVFEPLIQCAGGMRMYPPSYLVRARALCSQHQVLLIADEVAVGFGRTGTLFACNQGPVTPDLLCLGKGLSGGYLPLSVCLSTDTVYQAFYDARPDRAFLHSHSFTGNALGCAAAVATLALLDDVQLQRNHASAAHMGRELSRLKTHPNVRRLRQTGLVAALDLTRADGTPWPAHQRRGRRACTAALRAGALLRPLGDTLYLMPPYVINEQEITLLVRALETGISYASGE